ncbi:hypothetical protein ACFVFS_20055 [Kitasatospora sp. NPDC057692]|uniref:hypothetical protein n=1 Tax=Kitasatospora sp. NPDC057692 TaxID=3346215 RepID=UPI003693E1DE
MTAEDASGVEGQELQEKGPARRPTPDARRPRDAPPGPAHAAPEGEAPVRDSPTLWDKPLVGPRHIWWKHRLVLESHPDLPSPSPLDLITKRCDPGLWRLARRYRGGYLLPRSLSADHQEILRRARAAARAVDDAPAGIRDELLRRAEPLAENRLLLRERLLLLAQTLETGDEDPEFDAAAESRPFIDALEERAREAFELALRQAGAVEVVIAERLHLDGELYTVGRRNLRAVSRVPTVERLVCDCGGSRWLVVLIGRDGAIGCSCGRLRWENRLTREVVERTAPGVPRRFRPPFDLDAVAAEAGFGPFCRQW